MKTTLVAILLTLFVSPVFADHKEEGKVDPKQAEMMKKYEELATPGEEHKKLKELEGKWNYTSTWWQTPDAKPETSKGTSKMEMVLEDRFLQHKTESEAMGKKFHGLGFTGYDNLKKQYNTVWLDTMTTGMMLGTGTYDAKTATYKESGKYSCPETKSKNQSYRTEWKIVDKDNMIYTMYGPNKKGKEFKQMELVYKRN